MSQSVLLDPFSDIGLPSLTLGHPRKEKKLNSSRVKTVSENSLLVISNSCHHGLSHDIINVCSGNEKPKFHHGYTFMRKKLAAL